MPHHLQTRPQFPVLLLLGILTAGQAGAVVAPVPNASFEMGGPNQRAPAGWTLSGGSGAWESTGATGQHSISVTGNGQDNNWWAADRFSLPPGHRFRLRFWSRQAGSGTAVSGLTTNNRDFAPGSEWQLFSFVFRTPDTGAGPLRFGQWHATGKVQFDDISVVGVDPIYTRAHGLELGAGERVEGKSYEAMTSLGSEGSNDARFLSFDSASFNSDRWLMAPGTMVVYHHALPGVLQKGAAVRVNVNYHVAGRCEVEAHGSGGWVPVGHLDETGTRGFKLPAALFPARAIEVRLRAVPAAGGAAPEFQVDRYEYRSTLDREEPAISGATHYAEIEQSEAPDVVVTDWGTLKPGGAAVLRLGPEPAAVRCSVQSGDRKESYTAIVPPGPGPRTFTAPYAIRRAGEGTLRLDVLRRGKEVYVAAVPFQLSALEAADYGYRLAGPAPLHLWWAEGAYKIGAGRPSPVGTPRPVRLSAAGGEEEPFQLVLRPDRALQHVTVSISALGGPGGAAIEPSAWRLLHVGYVPVTQATDGSGSPGDWPDPLPPYEGSFPAEANRNHVLWLSVRVPEGTRAGDYHGAVTLRTDAANAAVPVTLHVWSFSLPRTPHVRSAMGISPTTLRQYYNLKTDEQLRQVWELYMKDYAAHRLNPDDPMELDPIRVSFTGEGDRRRVVLDTAAFDRAAHHYLDEMGFGAFRLNVDGMGGGTFFDRQEGEFGGYRAGTSEYTRLWGDYVRQLESHLREKGWLRKAYVYWFDEPADRDFPFVRAGMERLKQQAPGLNRLLTKEPRPELVGAVDLWCPILDAYDPGRARERQQAGEQVWWYICTGPKAPYPGEFIDRPATDLRVWVWDTWKYSVQGVLLWETTYWHSPTAYPDGLQDPWTDPMSWVEGYGAPAGARQPWGNGDGRFLYPPAAAARAAGTPLIQGPIDSIRWEMFRKGLEDYEYFWLLRDAIRKAEERGVPEAKLEPFRHLLEVPDDVTESLTSYSADPQPMLRHRDRLARGLESLRKLP